MAFTMFAKQTVREWIPVACRAELLLLLLLLLPGVAGCAPEYTPRTPLAFKLQQAGIEGHLIDYANRCAAGEAGLCQRLTRTLGYTIWGRTDSWQPLLAQLCRDQTLGPAAGACLALEHRNSMASWSREGPAAVDDVASLGCAGGEAGGRFCLDAGQRVRSTPAGLPLLAQGCQQGSVPSCCWLFVFYVEMVELQQVPAGTKQSPVPMAQVKQASTICEQALVSQGVLSW